MKTGENIRKMRKEKGMTQKQLAENSGLAAITIQQYEAGKYEPKNLSLKKLASALGCDVSELINIKEKDGHPIHTKRLADYSNDELLIEISKRLMKGEKGEDN